VTKLRETVLDAKIPTYKDESDVTTAIEDYPPDAPGDGMSSVKAELGEVKRAQKSMGTQMAGLEKKLDAVLAKLAAMS
jgi:hypothetical protein